MAALLSDAEIASFEVDLGLLVAAINSLAHFEYDGFNPVHYRRMFIKKMNQKGKTKAEISGIILGALSIVLMRGVKIKVGGNHKMKKEALTFAGELASLGFDLNPSAGSQSSDVITLGRTLSVFPLEASMMLASQKARVVGNCPTNLPMCFCHASIYSILPTTVDWKSEFMVALASWRKSFTVVIMPGKSEQQIIDSMSKFDPKIFASALYTPAQREKLLKKAVEHELSICDQTTQIKYKLLLDTDPAMKKLMS